jgi:hypothetical protein
LHFILTTKQKGVPALPGLKVALTQVDAQQAATPSQYAPLEVSFAYSYARANAGAGQYGCFNMNRGRTEVAFNALMVVASLTGERTERHRPACRIADWSGLNPAQG